MVSNSKEMLQYKIKMNYNKIRFEKKKGSMLVFNL